jgi:5-methylcytosine-specific restriction endonuclease McrA
MNEPVFKLSRVPGVPISDEELIADLRRVAEVLEKEYVSISQYEMNGKYSSKTQMDRFDTWNMALVRAGLKIYNVKANRARISELKLFENILILWQHYGHQPRVRDLASSPSFIYTEKPYRLHFGSWMNALKAFVDYANGTGVEAIENTIEEVTETPITEIDENRVDETVERKTEEIIVRKHKTGRNPSLRLRWRVLQRDNFRCRKCGRSPANTLGVELHVDHIDPWDNYGETVFENLQTLCSICNLGKSNLLPEVTDLLSH